MSIQISSVDMRAFRKAMENVQLVSRKTPAEQCNQRAMNVARRCLETMAPTDVSGARARVKRYMDTQLAQKVRVAKSGKRKDKFIKSGRKADQLQRKHLIAQYRNKLAGKKGLYGEAMRKAAGRLSGMAQISQGFLKSVFLPVIVGLYSVVKYRPPVSLTRDIARWPGSAGFGKATPATPGLNPTAIIRIGATVKNKIRGDQEGKVRAIYTEAITNAIAAETAEMEAHFDRQLKKELGIG